MKKVDKMIEYLTVGDGLCRREREEKSISFSYIQFFFSNLRHSSHEICATQHTAYRQVECICD